MPKRNVLIEWLVDWAELLAEDTESDDDAWKGIKLLCRRCRGISRFVWLWMEPETRAPLCSWPVLSATTGRCPSKMKIRQNSCRGF